MRRVLIASAAVLVIMIALPALAKGLIGVTIEGPGIVEPVFLGGDGTSASAEQFEEIVQATGFAEMAWGAAVTGENQILAAQPTDELGPEYLLTWIQAGPQGDAEIIALLYPFAVGGPLVYMEPGIVVIESSSTARGGWFVSSYDIERILREYGVDVSVVKSATASIEASQTPAAVPIAGAVGLGGIAVLASIWAIGRRPRRPRTS